MDSCTCICLILPTSPCMREEELFCFITFETKIKAIIITLFSINYMSGRERNTTRSLFIVTVCVIRQQQSYQQLHDEFFFSYTLKSMHVFFCKNSVRTFSALYNQGKLEWSHASVITFTCPASLQLV